MELPNSLEKKLNSIISFLEGKKVIVAFSGGVDSSLLAFLSKRYAKDIILVTEQSILYPEEEIDGASLFANKHGINHIIIDRNPLKDEDFQCNPLNRCYICKTGLYNKIIEIMNSKSFDVILDGSNISDLSDYRPGMQALKELSIFTPYIEFSINKNEIRKMCEYFDLEVQNKPSMACFSSRIPYGESISEKKIIMIREGEKYLKKQFNLQQLRVRYHKNKLARIEFLSEDLPKILNEKSLNLIKAKFRELGFIYITLDIEGFRSGSMNEPLEI